MISLPVATYIRRLVVNMVCFFCTDLCADIVHDLFHLVYLFLCLVTVGNNRDSLYLDADPNHSENSTGFFALSNESRIVCILCH